MRHRAQGYASIEVDGKVVYEADTITCGHCGLPIETKPGQIDTDSCLRCDAHICVMCAVKLSRELRCVPFEKTLDLIER